MYTRNTSSANAWPIWSIPEKSKITILKRSTLASRRFAWERETRSSLPYRVNDTGTTVLSNPYSPSETYLSNTDLMLRALGLCRQSAPVTMACTLRQSNGWCARPARRAINSRCEARRDYVQGGCFVWFGGLGRLSGISRQILRLIPQDKLLYLPGRGARDRGKFNPPRHFVRRKAFSAPLAQFFR